MNTKNMPFKILRKTLLKSADFSFLFTLLGFLLFHGFGRLLLLCLFLIHTFAHNYLLGVITAALRWQAAPLDLRAKCSGKISDPVGAAHHEPVALR